MDYAVSMTMNKLSSYINWGGLAGDDSESENNSDVDDDDDWYDGTPYSRTKKSNILFGETDVRDFLDKLLDNHVFDLGFQIAVKPYLISAVGKTDYCWCPCSKSMKPWKESSDLSYFCGLGTNGYCDKHKKFNYLGFMQHLKSKENQCPMHYGMRLYLQNLYSDILPSDTKVSFFHHENTFHLVPFVIRR